MSFLQNTKASILMTGSNKPGVGFSLAKQLVEAGHEVIVISKFQDRLDWVKQQCPKIITLYGLVSTEEGRLELFKTITSKYPQVNVIIQNAGSSSFPPPMKQLSPSDWQSSALMVLNKTLVARMHLTLLFKDFLKQKEHSANVSVISVAGFCPLEAVPFYSAAHAAVHAWSKMTCHLYFKEVPQTEVIEVILPAVQTLEGIEWIRAVGFPNCDVYAKHVVEQLVMGVLVIGFDPFVKGDVKDTRIDTAAATVKTGVAA